MPCLSKKCPVTNSTVQCEKPKKSALFFSGKKVTVKQSIPFIVHKTKQSRKY